MKWRDAKAYITWLSKGTGKHYRLLTDAEYEYSAWGQVQPGEYPRYFFGDSPMDMCRYGNAADQTAKLKIFAPTLTFFPRSDGYVYTSQAGSFRPNAFGLYDMAGNLWQWVEDCYIEDESSAPRDGTAVTEGDCNRRVLRGGSWGNEQKDLRAALRVGSISSEGRAYFAGYRVARTLNP